MGKKGHLTFEKRALNIRMGVRRNFTHPHRYATGYTLKTQHIILIVMFRKYPQRFIHILILLTSAHFHSYVRFSYVKFGQLVDIIKGSIFLGGLPVKFQTAPITQ